MRKNSFARSYRVCTIRLREQSGVPRTSSSEGRTLSPGSTPSMLQLPKRILSSSAWSSDTPKIVLRSRVKNSDPKGRTAVRSVLCSYTSVIDVVSAPMSRTSVPL